MNKFRKFLNQRPFDEQSKDGGFTIIFEAIHFLKYQIIRK